MSKRALMMFVALVAALALAATGTLAYLTDTDSDVNVMTLGNVEIEQHELKRVDGIAHNATLAEGDLVPFVDGIKLYPAYPVAENPDLAYEAKQLEEDSIKWGPYVHEYAWNGLWSEETVIGAVDKMVFVENTGTSDAYVRTILAFEKPEGVMIGYGSEHADIVLNMNGNYRYNNSEGTKSTTLMCEIEIDGVNYEVYEFCYSEVMKPGQWTRPSLLQVVMTHWADNEVMKLLGDTYEVLALSQAVQVENLDTLGAQAALDAAFGKVNKENATLWFSQMEGLPVATASTADELATALAAGGTVVLTDDIELDTVKVMATIPQNTDVTLVLGGNTITAKLESENSPTSVFNVKPGATLTITGEGEINVEANKTLSYTSAIINNEAGNVVIDGGTYRMTYGSYAEGYLLPTIVDNNSTLGASTVTINGGDFYHTRNMFRNFSNNKTQAAAIIINGGTFSGDADDAGAIWNQKPSGSIPNGAGVVVVNGGTFTNMEVSNEFDDSSVVTVADGIALPVVQD